MCCCKNKHMKKVSISLMSAVLFFIIANPETFKFMNNLLGGGISNGSGCPTSNGLLLHTFVFFLVTLILMYI